MFEEQIRKATELFREQEYSEATIILQEVVTQQPRHRSAWMGLAACTQDPVLKEYYYTKVLQIDPGNEQAKRSLAGLKQGNPTGPRPFKESQPVDRKSRPRVRAERVSAISQFAEDAPQKLENWLSRVFPREYVRQNSRFILAIGIILVLLILMLLVGLIISNAGPRFTDVFKDSVRELISQGEVMDAMSVQGVFHTELRRQLGQVKASLLFTGDKWPSSLKKEEAAMRRAVQGWDIGLQVINDNTDYGTEYYYAQDALVRECLQYLELQPGELDLSVDTNDNQWLFSSQNIAVLVFQEAGKSFKEARSGIYEKMH